ncbi:MAG: hypothetical protein VYD18_05755 [Candidatus Latescibacterota bacterium]|nr:hypothetical protein [Candidatus Latescibacterota bacterium]
MTCWPDWDGTPDPGFLDSPLEEASLVTAYALAQTALGNNDERRRLGGAFDGPVESRQELSASDARRLRTSRERVDRICREHLEGPGESKPD